MSEVVSNVPVLAQELRYLGYEELTPWAFYSEIFPEGELGNWGDDPEERKKGEYTGIAVEITNEKNEKGKTLVRRYTISNEMDNLDLLLNSKNFCVMSPISYAGKSRVSKNARFMYALCVELDGLIVDKDGKQQGLDALIQTWSERVSWIPQPTLLVASGNGLHLYYVFEKAIPLFKNVVDSLKKYKDELTFKLWNHHVTELHSAEKIQYESIFQAFRIPGTLTKNGEVATAFRVGEKVSIEYMNRFVNDKNHIELVYKTNLTRAQAAEKYPEWYERRIVRGDKCVKKWDYSKQKGHNGDEMYNWWLRRIEAEALVGKRYYCLMMLAIYALKCDIDQERLEADCFRLMRIFDEKSVDDKNRFTEKDVLDALQAFEDESLITYPVNSIRNRSGINIVKNKRNKRPQAKHLQGARALQAIDDPEGLWRNKDGRPTAQETVLKWRAANPDGTKYKCAKDTGLDKKTVYKWWDSTPHILTASDAPELDEFDLDLDAAMYAAAKALEDETF